MRFSGDLTLSTGRSISLTSLKQWKVYDGLLEGLPTREMNAKNLQGLVDNARQTDNHEPFLIEPEQRPIEYEGRYPFGEPASLPPIGCIGKFHSHDPTRGSQKSFSGLTVIWFQNDYAFPLSENVEQAIRELDWDRLAWDGDW